MTIDEFKEVVGKVKLWNMTVAVDGVQLGYVKLKYSMLVADRDSGTPFTLYFTFLLSAEMLDQVEEDIALYHIRQGGLNFVTHEFDEMFLFEGKRIYDPHIVDNLGTPAGRF